MIGILFISLIFVVYIPISMVISSRREARQRELLKLQEDYEFEMRSKRANESRSDG